jgi:hypothetical protein
MMPPNTARKERFNLAQTLIFFSPSESYAPSRAAFTISLSP